MKAHEIMNNQVVKVKEQDSVYLCIKKMLQYNISGLPVVNERNELKAFLSDGDIMRAVGKTNEIVLGTLLYADVFQIDPKGFEERAQEILTLNVMEIAQKKVYTVKLDEEVENITTAMAKQKIKQLPVERNGVLVGMISRGDVIRNTFKSINECLKKSVC
ncbi:CBS domain-containing protein [Bacillus benzoevorans]|uniref:Putative transcriptional regulator n=1 Tax=Bacillus benzoevorans TaxID=1456 RepID=A0A7X0HND2_9BACI|nr:CBS domain-containing protein [Bacillus benzoevorans]MBB6443970.1 putative transcriptional regulator [Bacillus benzoevorans]